MNTGDFIKTSIISCTMERIYVEIGKQSQREDRNTLGIKLEGVLDGFQAYIDKDKVYSYGYKIFKMDELEGGVDAENIRRYRETITSMSPYDDPLIVHVKGKESNHYPVLDAFLGGINMKLLNQ
jgi:hypothetical protein